MQGDGGLPGGFRPEDLDDPAPRNAADAQGRDNAQIAAAPAQVRELLQTEGYFAPQVQIVREGDFGLVPAQYASSLALIKGGKLKALGIAAPKRSAFGFGASSRSSISSHEARIDSQPARS